MKSTNELLTHEEENRNIVRKKYEIIECILDILRHEKNNGPLYSGTLAFALYKLSKDDVRKTFLFLDQELLRRKKK